MQKETKNRLEIFDKENNLLALKVILDLQKSDKEFHTSNEQSFQLGTFNLEREKVLKDMFIWKMKELFLILQK